MTVREDRTGSLHHNGSKALGGLERHVPRGDRQVMERDAARPRIGRQLRRTQLVFTFAVRSIIDDASETFRLERGEVGGTDSERRR